MGISNITASDESTQNKDQPNGYAGLDANGLISTSQIDIGSVLIGTRINTVADFPSPVGGFIELENNTLYMIDGPFIDITPTAPNGFKVPTNCSLISTNPTTNILLYSGTGTMFTGAAVDSIYISPLILLGALAGPSTSRLFDLTFAPIGLFKALVCTFTATNGFNDLGSVNGANIVQINNVLFNDKNKPLVLIDCLNSIFSNMQLTPGNVGVTGSITAFTVSASETRVTTSVAHGLQSFQKIKILDSGVGAYDDVHIITVVDSTNVTIPVTFVSDPATGTFLSVSGINSGRGEPFIELRGTHNLFVMNNSPVTPAFSDSVLNIDPDLNIAEIAVSNSPFSKAFGSVYFKQGVTGSITAFSDPGGGETTVTSVSHGLTTGDTLLIKDSLIDEYDGGHTITVLDTDNFKIPVTFVSNPATGTWDTSSIDEKDIRVEYQLIGEQKDSVVVLNSFLNTPDTVVINTIGVYEPSSLTITNWPCGLIERFKCFDNAIFECIGLKPIVIRITLTSTMEKVGGGADQIAQAIFFKDVSEPSPDFVILNETVSVTQNSTPTTVMSHVNILMNTGDQVQIRWANLDSTSNIVNSLSTISIKE